MLYAADVFKRLVRAGLSIDRAPLDCVGPLIGFTRFARAGGDFSQALALCLTFRFAGRLVECMIDDGEIPVLEQLVDRVPNPEKRQAALNHAYTRITATVLREHGESEAA